MSIRYGSVCSGIEAATRAWHPLGWTPAFFSEIEPFPSAVLAHHYGSNMPGETLTKNGIPNYGDFTTIGPDAGPIDLLVGGTPCQSFSVAGKRLGLDDPRGNLALEYLALARRLGARWIVWENVPGVLSSVSDEEDGEGDLRSGLEGREAGDEWIEESDFATFLEFVRECGYGFAYRVLDAQFVRVDGFSRAVPQRRRRVFVVGYLGDWRPAAAVLLEPESMRGDSAPRREAGQRVAPTIASRTLGGGGLGTDFELDGGLIAADVAPTIMRNSYSPTKSKGGEQEIEFCIAHALRGESFDASEDGTGRGTPIVPVFSVTQDSTPLVAEDIAPTLKLGTGLDIGQPHAVAFAIQERAVSENTEAGPQGAGFSEDGAAYTLEARHHVQAVAFSENIRGEVVESDVARALQTQGGKPGQGYPAVRHGWAVRRLTPRECERLQGFPDDFTNVPWRGKEESSDGPRYKALGNSMAVNVMRWIGMRIDMMERLIQSGKVPS